MKLFEKISTKLINGKSRLFKFFNIPIIQFEILNKHIKIKFPLLNKEKYCSTLNTDKSVFYLKVNRREKYSFICLQQWINIINYLDSDFYIICDNEELKTEILKKIVFKNSNIKFISSYTKPFKNIVKKNFSKNWYKAAYAHLSTFYHAQQHGFKSFWNIDADDAILLINPDKAANMLDTIGNYAVKNDIKAFSLDFWTSLTQGQNWTFGITYVDSSIDWFKYLKNIPFDWRDKFKDINFDFNLDWIFNYMKIYEDINIKTFYIENLHFIHWGDFLINPYASQIYHWYQGKLQLPLLETILQNKDITTMSIPEECIKFDFNINENEYIEFILQYITAFRLFPCQWIKLYGLEKFMKQEMKNINIEPIKII